MADPQERPDDGPDAPPPEPSESPPAPPAEHTPDGVAKKPPTKKAPAKAAKKAPAKRAPAKRAAAQKAPAEKAEPAEITEPPPPEPAYQPPVDTNGARRLGVAAKEAAAHAKSTVDAANNPIAPATPSATAPRRSPVPLVAAIVLSLLAVLSIRQLRRALSSDTRSLPGGGSRP